MRGDAVESLGFLLQLNVPASPTPSDEPNFNFPNDRDRLARAVDATENLPDPPDGGKP